MSGDNRSKEVLLTDVHCKVKALDDLYASSYTYVMDKTNGVTGLTV